MCLAGVLLLVCKSAAFADVTNVLVDADAEAFLEGFTPDTGVSAATSETFSLEVIGSGSGATSNSTTSTTMNYAWNGTSLSGEALITQTKTVNARPGGLHGGLGNLCFSFTVDTDTDYVLDGAFGYVGATAADEVDSVMWKLESTDAGIFFDSGTAPTSTASVIGEPFSGSGVLSPGDYKFTITADFHESINSQDTRQAGWTLNGFTLTPTAIPEPTSIGLLAFCMLYVAGRRRHRKCPRADDTTL